MSWMPLFKTVITSAGLMKCNKLKVNKWFMLGCLTLWALTIACSKEKKLNKIRRKQNGFYFITLCVKQCCLWHGALCNFDSSHTMFTVSEMFFRIWNEESSDKCFPQYSLDRNIC